MPAELSGLSRLFIAQSCAVADQMSQTLLLRHAFQFDRIVTPASVTDQDAAEIGGDQFPDLLIAMLWADLIHRKRLTESDWLTNAIRNAVFPATRQPVSSVCTAGCCETNARKA